MAASVTGLMMAATVSSMAVLAGLCAACNTAGVVCMAAHVRASRDTAGVVCMAAHVCAACNTAGVVCMAAHVRAPRNTAGIMGVAAHVRASRNAAGIVCMAAHVCAPRQTAVMIPMAIVSGVRIAVHPVVHVNFCLGTSRNAAFFVAVFACHGTAVDAAGPVCMNGLQAAPRQTAVMIPMAIVSGVRIAVHPVVHVNFCLGTSRNAAFFVAVFACHGTAVDAAGPVCMNGFQAALRQTAVMIPMAVVIGVRIVVRPIMHVRCRFGTSRNVASAVAVLACERTAVDAAEAMHMRLRLCTSGNRAGKDCLSLLCLVRDFHGTSVHRIGDNAACYHGNRYKRNG